MINNVGEVVGRIVRVFVPPAGMPWMWSLAEGFREDHILLSGHEATREAALEAFSKSWRQD